MTDEPVATAATLGAASRRSRRSILAGVALVLACLSILLTTVAIWTHQVAFNTDRFTSLVDTVIAEPAVIDPLGERISVQVVDALDVQTRIETRLPDIAKSLAAPLTIQIREAVDRRLQTRPGQPAAPGGAQHDRRVRPRSGSSTCCAAIRTRSRSSTATSSSRSGRSSARRSTSSSRKGSSRPTSSCRTCRRPSRRASCPGAWRRRSASRLPADFGTIQLMPADKLLDASRTFGRSTSSSSSSSWSASPSSLSPCGCRPPPADADVPRDRDDHRVRAGAPGHQRRSWGRSSPASPTPISPWPSGR